MGGEEKGWEGEEGGSGTDGPGLVSDGIKPSTKHTKCCSSCLVDNYVDQKCYSNDTIP